MMQRVRNSLIIATRMYKEDGTYAEDIVRICMDAENRGGQPIWEMSDDAARKLRDQLTNILGD